MQRFATQRHLKHKKASQEAMHEHSDERTTTDRGL
jgi:hypothetical protein